MPLLHSYMTAASLLISRLSRALDLVTLPASALPVPAILNTYARDKCNCRINNWLPLHKKCGEMMSCPFGRYKEKQVDTQTYIGPPDRLLISPPKMRFTICTGHPRPPSPNDPLARLMTEARWEFVYDYQRADAIVFPGGADVNPEMYKETKHPKTYIDTARDARWQSTYGHIRSNRYLKIGICAGAQFLCVANGGRLWQDVDGHAVHGTHEAIYGAKNGDRIVYDVTSTHHQMMRPSGQWAEVWAWAKQATYRDTGEDRHKDVQVLDGHDPEVVFFSHTNSLCFQPHPEYNSESCKKLFFKCLTRAVTRWGIETREAI